MLKHKIEPFVDPLLLALFFAFLSSCRLGASNLDVLGVTLLRQVDPTLTGTGIKLAQVEAPAAAGTPPVFEVNPAHPQVNQTASLFTYTSSSGTANGYPNSVGTDSGHADTVAANYFGVPGGIAPGFAHLDDYEANYFYNSIISALLPPTIAARIVNQSFVFGSLTPAQQAAVEQNYDDYAVSHNTLFLSGAGNGGAVSAPATSFNGLGVGVSDGGSSVGPTTDGRSKPDIMAPGNETSFSTPYVSGAAAILLQAANRGDGGANTSAAGDLRTLKALLLNGAIKPSNWTNSTTRPLDARYGAGIANVFNSWRQLSGGRRLPIETTSHSSGGAHPPGANLGNESVLAGWDLSSITNSRVAGSYQDRVNHYYFQLNGTDPFTLTATLAWNRQANQTAINDLNLFLYDVGTSNLVVSSTSAVDNVEHLFLTNLPPGRYDLQVLKNPAGQVSTSESYALAFEFFSMPLQLTATATNLSLSWPVAPTGFRLLTTSALSEHPVWTPVTTASILSNDQQVLTLPRTSTMQFFRLVRP